MLSIAGSLLAEIGIPKLIVAWVALIGLPALMLGAMPIVASIWVSTTAVKLDSLTFGLVPLLFLALLAIVGILGGRRLFRIAERSFLSLHSLAVQPVYAVCRELFNQVIDRMLPANVSPARRAAWRIVTTAASGVVICLLSVGILALAWPHVRVAVDASALGAPLTLVKAALANSIALVSAYVAIAALVWSAADATTPPTREFTRYTSPSTSDRTWRIAHLSDIHAVGERYGYRIESGRAGPQGNERLAKVLAKLVEIHAAEPLDAVLITGDLTDAGLGTEWAEFLDALASFPQLKNITFAIPGNHDVNIVNRANPAQFDLPTSPYRKLRKLRVLSALNEIQGSRVHVVDHTTKRLGGTLSQALQPHFDRMQQFADTRRPRIAWELSELWSSVFPMIVPPSQDDGLGLILLNSNADAHFSFTNALGMVPAEQLTGFIIAAKQYPRACWVIGIHHHVVEYPRSATALSERIGTTLINGPWFLRRLRPFSDRVLIMHGHRHIDWLGESGDLGIFSAPSTVMGTSDDPSAYFYIHTIATAQHSRLGVAHPQRISVS